MSNLLNWKAAPSVEDLLALSAALLARWWYPGGSRWHWSPIGGSSGSLAVSSRISLALVTYRRLFWLAGGILADLAGPGHLSAALLARLRYPRGSPWHWSPIGGSRRLFWFAGGILADLAGTGHLSAALLARWRYPGGSCLHWSPDSILL